MQPAAEAWSITTRRAIAAAACIAALVFALALGAGGGLAHAAGFAADRAAGLVRSPASVPQPTPAEPMWTIVPCRLMEISPARIDLIQRCAWPPRG